MAVNASIGSFKSPDRGSTSTGRLKHRAAAWSKVSVVALVDGRVAGNVVAWPREGKH
ncbi:hypothetical protein [Amycolatopsis sp. NPDC051071]|uniref:hypothetical protein n=1 Tax=Amycolatopsis sp. NPDC051071 TaxID=3154637 RepID=UPI003417DCD7